MCGITGLIDPCRVGDAESLRRIATAMNDSLTHRGPDHGAVESDAGAGLAFGHRRLAIVDLSPAGEQPMTSSDGRHVIVYNGEVYNAEELRRELPALAWRGHSDTEVILEACARWGVEATARRLIGMFAFALWDRQERALWLVRDRLGIKPLYWTLRRGVFAFGSELKALHGHPDLALAVDPAAVAAYCRFGYVPAPHSIYRGVQKLMPGHVLRLSRGGEIATSAFWSLEDVVREACAAREDLDEATAADRLEALLRDAVGRRMIADVPLGAFLSGGIDSSLVTALMQVQSPQPVKTFSIGFAESGYNEAPFAAAVARHLGTDHTELYVSDDDALAVIPNLALWYDEPFADSSQIPTYLVSALARRHVKVALSGDGGDELFAGYTRYGIAQRYLTAIAATPASIRRAAAASIRAVPPVLYDSLAQLLPPTRRPAMAGVRAHKLADVVALPDAAALYARLISTWGDPGALVATAEVQGPHRSAWRHPSLADVVERMQYVDALTYLPDDILTKVDRASMAVALEVRVPLLDHRLVAFAWSLPMHMKIRGGETKWLLRRVLDRHVPRALIDRPKAGFGVPVDAWLRGRLRDWVEDLLSEKSLREAGLVAPGPVREAWHEHLSGRRARGAELWTILMLQAWWRRWGR